VARTHSALQAFGLKLRQLREEAGLNGKQLAERLRWQPSKLSRVENGKQTVSPEDLAEWADGLGVSTPIRDGLLAELHDSRLEYATWKQQLAAGTFDRQHASLRREAGATSISVFESAIVPGLLQTPEYARHVLTGVMQTYGTTDDVDAGVRARIERQAALYDPTKRWRFLMTEAVLLYRLAPAQIMLAQLDRLTMLAGLDSIEIRIVPFTARYVIAPWNGCFIFDDDHDRGGDDLGRADHHRSRGDRALPPCVRRDVGVRVGREPVARATPGDSGGLPHRRVGEIPAPQAD